MFCRKRDDQLLGTEPEAFELIIKADWCKKGTVLSDTRGGHLLEIIEDSVPIINNRWDRIKVFLDQFRFVRWIKKSYIGAYIFGFGYKNNVKLVKPL